jgi:uncharacterized protein (DUF433 family)
MLLLEPVAPPLAVWDGGVVRVGKTRVSLDLVIRQYENGMTPEDMVRAYDTLVLADVYGAIAYYLRNRDAVQTYLKRREEEAAALQAMIEARTPRITREELLARGGKRGQVSFSAHSAIIGCDQCVRKMKPDPFFALK